MAQINIYSKEGVLKYTCEKLDYQGVFMGACHVSVSVKSAYPIPFAVGDYISYRGENYTLNYSPDTKKNSSSGTNIDSYTYDNIVFQSVQDETVRCKFRDFVLEDNTIHFTQLSIFTFYDDGSLFQVRDRVQANLDRLYTGDNKWTIEVAPGVTARDGTAVKDHTYSVSNMSVWDILAEMNTQQKVNFVRKGRTITIGAQEMLTDKTKWIFGYGDGNMLTSIETQTSETENVITRMHAYGNSTNMPYRYYNKLWTADDIAANSPISSMNMPRLCLPYFAKLAALSNHPDGSMEYAYYDNGFQITTQANAAYIYTKIWKNANTQITIGGVKVAAAYVSDVWIDSVRGIAKYEIKEDDVYFDTDSIENIYPSMKFMIGSNTVTGQDNTNDNGVAAKDGLIYAPDGSKALTFTVTIPNVGFSVFDEDVKTGETPQLSMTSGMCGSRNFDINHMDAIKDVNNNIIGYTLECKRTLDQSLNLYYPYNDYHIKSGDSFTFVNIFMSNSYVEAASSYMLGKALIYLSLHDTNTITIKPTIDNVLMAEQIADEGYYPVRDIIKEGLKLSITDDDLSVNTLSGVTISSLTIKEGEGDIPEYEITLSDDKEADLAQRVVSEIKDYMTVAGGGINTSEIAAIVKLEGQNRFVSKLSDDVVNGNINFKQDITVDGDTQFGKNLKVEGDTQFGANYVEGITGMGGKIDKDANAELESLTLRKFLQVPEIDYNRVDIKVGDKWRAPGGGVIKSVDTDNKIVTLKLEDGEIGAVEVGDICMGIFHSTTTSNNSTSNYDDSKGNRTFAGFFTCYFHIIEVLDTNHTQFKYELRPIDDNWKLSFAPCEAMNFVGYGNFTNVARQTSVYETTTYTRMLVGQNTWEFSIDNIAMQYGNLTNLDIFGLDMTGYSIYLSNIYMKGQIKQVKDNGSEIKQINFLSNYTVGQNVDYYDALYYNGSTWVCINKNGTNTTPSENDTINWMILAKQGSSVKVASEYQENVTNTAGTILSFYNMLFAARVDTQQPPLEILSDQDGTYITDENGNYLLYVQNGDVVQNNDWILLIDMRTVANAKDGQNGESLEVRYSSDKSNWHEVYLDGDIWMQQRVGSNNVWSSAMRVVGESGTDGVDGKYTVYEFAKNTSTDIAPTSGWQDAPMATSIGEYLWMRSGVVIPPATTPSSWAAVRLKGDSGDSGDSVKLLYRYEIDKPTKPTGSNPNGWSNTPDKEIIAITHGTNFTLEDGYYVSPAISHGSIIKNRIYFSTTKVNQSIAIELSVSSEPTYDCALIGILDDNNLTINSNYTKKISGITTIIAIVDIPNIGSHFIDVGYAKDSTVSNNDDNCKYRIVDINKCWISTG